MKVINLISKMGGASNVHIRINEGFKTVCEVPNRDHITVENLKKTVNFFNIVDNTMIIQVKEQG